MNKFLDYLPMIFIRYPDQISPISYNDTMRVSLRNYRSSSEHIISVSFTNND